MIHKLMHLAGWINGTVVSWRDGNREFVGFKCGKCGKIEGATDVTARIDRDIAEAMQRRK
jgi:hypothetical protein